jgi:hypothetical protein
MVAGDVISIGRQVIKFMYFSRQIKRELVRFDIGCDQKG